MPITRSLICLAVALWALPATAQGLDSERARTLIEDILYVYAPRDGAPFALATTGEPRITTNGARQDVALPGLKSVIYGISIDLGDVVLSLEDAGGDQVTMNATLPEQFTLHDPLGEPIGELTLAAPRFVGVWDRGLFAFRKLDAGAENLTIASADASSRLTIRHFAVAGVAEPVGPQRWQSEHAVEMAGVELYDSAIGGRVTIDLLRYGDTLRNIDLASLGALVQATRFDPLSMWPRAQLSEDLLDLAADVYDFVAIDAQETTLEASGLQITGDPDFTMSIAEIALSSHWTNLAGGRATIENGARLSGMAVGTNQPPEVTELIPTEIDFRVDGRNLPLAQLLRAMSAFARETDVPVEELEGMANSQLAFELRRLFSEAGAEFRIVDSRILAPAASARIDGAAVIDATSVAGLIGSLTLELAGLDRVMGMAMEQGGEAAQAAMVLLILQGLGEQVTLTNGIVVRRYVLTLDGDGVVRLNGTDLGPLMQSLQKREG